MKKQILITTLLSITSVNAFAEQVFVSAITTAKANYEIKAPTNIKPECTESLTRSELETLISTGTEQEISEACTKDITDFNRIFMGSSKNPDISNWDVSSGTNFEFMFYSARNFNQDISSWNVSNAKTMKSMFSSTDKFNQDIGNWDVSNVEDFSGMFKNAESFNKDIGNWNTSSGKIFRNMFLVNPTFNQDISKWNVSNGEDFFRMFDQSEAFNKDISNWNVDNARIYDDFYSESLLTASQVPEKFR
ncbi:BspA family leucine-rich repeat surface protein [Vibrio parahaemolyticus]